MNIFRIYPVLGNFSQEVEQAPQMCLASPIIHTNLIFSIQEVATRNEAASCIQPMPIVSSFSNR